MKKERKPLFFYMDDLLGLGDFILLGHSTGGAIAVRYMSRHKGYGVDKLILCAAAALSVHTFPMD